MLYYDTLYKLNVTLNHYIFTTLKIMIITRTTLLLIINNFSTFLFKMCFKHRDQRHIIRIYFINV